MKPEGHGSAGGRSGQPRGSRAGPFGSPGAPRRLGRLFRRCFLGRIIQSRCFVALVVVVNVAVSRVPFPNVIISLEDVRNRVTVREKFGRMLELNINWARLKGNCSNISHFSPKAAKRFNNFVTILPTEFSTDRWPVMVKERA